MCKALGTIFTGLMMLLAAAGCTSWWEPSDKEIKEIQAHIESQTPPRFASDKRHQDLWKWTKQIYASRQFRPAWTARGRIHSRADKLMETLEHAAAEGLHPDDLGVAELRMMRDSDGDLTGSASQIDFDIHLTYSLVRYVSHLCFGRIHPKAVNPNWQASEKTCEVPSMVYEAIEHSQFEHLAEQLAPGFPEYQALKQTLQQYRELAAKGGWKTLPANTAAKPVEQQHSTLLINNLTLMGDLSGSSDTGVSNEALAAAVRRFKSRHGLNADDILDDKTVRAMNVSVQERIEQIEVNLDRLRWIGDNLGPSHIRVNVPAFELSVHEGDQVPLQMRVIVGSSENRTPIFSSEMKYLVFSPYWNIPLSIATNELLPKIQQDPNYFRRQQIEVVRPSGDGVEVLDPSRIDWDEMTDGLDYQLRQKPGASNSLGLVKFIFPNPFDVYLHDTPSDNLFDRLTRTLSHGCIRVERPAELAAYVLNDQPEWTAERIAAAMRSGKEQRVSLKRPLPVHILYWTAWAGTPGGAQFREDVYGYDRKHRSLTCRGWSCSE